MTTRVIRSKVGADGVLHLDLPLGIQEASQEVDVIVRSATSKKTRSDEEWKAWVIKMAGCIDDPSFVRHHQGQFEERLPL